MMGTLDCSMKDRRVSYPSTGSGASGPTQNMTMGIDAPHRSPLR